MLKKILRKSLIILLCQTLGYAPLLSADQLSLPSGDLIAPEISQDKYVNTVAQGEDHQITVTVTDNVAVKQVTLYYRTIGTEEYQRMAMANISNTDEYQAAITSDQIKAPGVEYYVQAMDNAGNTLLHGYSFSPLSVKTVPADTAVAASSNDTTISTEKSSNKWLWIGLGVLAVGLVAASGGGGDDSPPSTATLNVNASDPTQ